MATEAEILRDQGIQRAVDHADRVESKWSDRAYEMLVRHAKHLGQGSNITSEAIRNHAEWFGLPPPPDKRAWGAVMLRAARAGVIAKVGWTTANDPKVHCNPVSLWQVK
jgi:hypothetical protein